MIHAAKNLTPDLFLILVFLFNISLTSAEEVCKFFYSGYPEDLNGKEVTVPDNTVALSENIKVGSPTHIPENTPDGVSIFIVIDHSESMTWPEIDRPGNRFAVLYELIDTIHQRMPLSEVGLAVFRQDLVFSDEDSPYFEKAPNFKVNSYLKLMELDKTYENNEKGADILRKYLDSEINAQGIGDMVYKHSLPYQELKTNINCGFDAARHAMLSAKWPKHKQFVIFVSDGEATQPLDGTKDDYIQGTDVPTTFTIFFSQNQVVPRSIQRMSENIKNNGYSLSNILSRYWGYDNSGNVAVTRDKLKNFLLENVISVIFKQTVLIPRNLTVNGSRPVSKLDKSSSSVTEFMFVFDKMFPLTGLKTDFSQIIDYNVVTDSTAPDGKTKQYERDSTVSVEFSVKIDKNAQSNSNYLFECWDRKLQFFYNDKPVEIADETMDELEIRFIEDKVDILYGYENINVDISNTETPKNDLENFKMKDNGSYFSYTFKREFSSQPEHGDNKLGHAFEDSIIAFFRNHDLPLDTLRYAIPFRVSGTIGIKYGYYYDNNADGYIDSIFLESKGVMNKTQALEFVDMVTLPSHRGFELINIEAYDDGIGLTVRQKDIKYDDKMVTYTTKEDVLVIKEGFLPSGGWIIADTVEIKDKVAPVIMKASLIIFGDPGKNDILTVTFSEPVLKVTGTKPFYFWSGNPGNLLYTADVRLERSASTTMTFVFKSIEGVTQPIDRVTENDSIWIFWKDKQVGDKLFNYQHNKKNRRRLLEHDRRFEVIGLTPKGVNPYDRNNPENHEIPSHIIKILPEDNAAEIAKNSYPNSGMLIKVIPKFAGAIDRNPVTDFVLKGSVAIFDVTGNTVLDRREMGFHEKTKSLNFVWNGRNTLKRSCGKGSYLALFKVAMFKGPESKYIGNKILKMILVLN